MKYIFPWSNKHHAFTETDTYTKFYVSTAFAAAIGICK